MFNGSGIVNWTEQLGAGSRTELAWDRLEVFAIPVSRSDISLTTDADLIILNRPVALPVLGGRLNINRLRWQGGDQAAQADFEAVLERVSLNNLSEALDWKPLKGEISGVIPGISLLNGELTISVFSTITLSRNKAQ